MDHISIERRVELPAKYLSSNIKTHIINKVRKDTATECTKEYGYILKVYEKIEILENENTVFRIRFWADTLIPKKGEKMTGLICMVYPSGIFIEIEGKQQVLVAKSSLEGYVYDDNEKTYTKKDHVLEEKSQVTVLIKDLKYSDGMYRCFGSLVMN